MTYWHFTGETLRDGRPIPPIGEWLVHTGPIEMCKSGLHASADPFDALTYAPGPVLHRVELDDIRETQDDKVVARKRKILASVDLTSELRLFAVWCAQHALKVVPSPDPRSVAACDVAERFARGEATRKELAAARAAARAAAWNAAWAAAWDAARAAAWDAQRTEFSRRVLVHFPEVRR